MLPSQTKNPIFNGISMLDSMMSLLSLFLLNTRQFLKKTISGLNGPSSHESPVYLSVRASKLGRNKLCNSLRFDSRQEHSKYCLCHSLKNTSLSLNGMLAIIPEDHTNPHEVQESRTLELEPIISLFGMFSK